MRLPPPTILDASGKDLAEGMAGLSAEAGVFAIEVAGRTTYLSSATNLQRRVVRTLGRLSRLTTAGEPQQRISIHCWCTGSKLHTSLVLYYLAKQHFPGEYLQRLHLRMPWFVGLLTHDPFPRLITANRIPLGCEPVIGPFARRDLAQLYEQELQSAFLLRRCTDVLAPREDHPGCIYGEINQCLRPCQMAVDTSRYLSEAAEVSGFLRENGGGLLRVLTTERDSAVEATDFELAARIHKRLDKLKGAKDQRDPATTDVHNFHGVVVVRAGKSHLIQIIPIVEGEWRQPVSFDARIPMNGQHVEGELHSLVRLAMAEEESREEETPPNRLEHLALGARWYYSSWREGVWIPFTRLDDLPYRKILRSLRKLVKPEEAVSSQ